MSTPDSSETTAASSVFVCPMHPEVRQVEPGNCPKCGMHLVPESELEVHSAHDHHDHQAGAAPADGRYDLVPQGHDGPIYTCPMHPEIVRDAPGDCPKCGMTLVPRETASDGHGGHGGHDMPPEDRSNPADHAHAGHAEDAGGAGAYTCPMHPEVVSDAPGKCPKCGMFLVLSLIHI